MNKKLLIIIVGCVLITIPTTLGVEIVSKPNLNFFDSIKSLILIPLLIIVFILFLLIFIKLLFNIELKPKKNQIIDKKVKDFPYDTPKICPNCGLNLLGDFLISPCGRNSLNNVLLCPYCGKKIN